jgi:hypothetical protein
MEAALAEVGRMVQVAVDLGVMAGLTRISVG